MFTKTRHNSATNKLFAKTKNLGKEVGMGLRVFVLVFFIWAHAQMVQVKGLMTSDATWVVQITWDTQVSFLRIFTSYHCIVTHVSINKEREDKSADPRLHQQHQNPQIRFMLRQDQNIKTKTEAKDACQFITNGLPNVLFSYEILETDESQQQNHMSVIICFIFHIGPLVPKLTWLSQAVWAAVTKIINWVP